jgi:pimeloyl-ACP methyl ester carboxylesterase
MNRPPGRKPRQPANVLTGSVGFSRSVRGQGTGREGQAIRLDVSEVLLRRIAAALLPYTASTTFAVATELGIHAEAALRVLADRAGAAPRTLRSADRPVVHWHDGGSGPALLLLNGWSASGLVWPQRWLTRLEERYRVIRVDNRGSGWSRSAPYPFTIADMADDARDVLRACGIDRAVVLGLSMGGMIAQELAIRHGGPVDKLVLAATRPPAKTYVAPGADMFGLMLSQPPQNMTLPEFFTATWAQTTGDGFATDNPAILAEIADQITQRITPRRAALNQARAIVAWHDAKRLRRISTPTTVVHGERDPLIPVENGKRLAKLIPGAAYVQLAGVGHLVAHEAGDALLEVLGE